MDKHLNQICDNPFCFYHIKWTAQGSVFDAVCDFFVCVWNISGTAEQVCAKFTWKTWTCLKVKVKGQGHQEQKVTFFGPFGGLCAVPHTHTHHTHNRFTALSPGPPGWAGARRELLDFMVQGKINRGRHTDHLAGCHSIRTNQCLPPPSPHIFYRPDALPAAQPTASKHWRQPPVWGLRLVKQL